ncbi:MAG: serine/threonine-protein phosphatase [Propionibacteriaceae bacterium]|jgi:serine/threonine protein phosphatase PrpC|nr:serine/threonine-protein phosphatase [Propionibacteriaceae bacterium]
MTLFNRGAPGVEWNPGDPEATQPQDPPSSNPHREDFTAYPSTCPACGGELGIDAYCLQCGQKAKSLREHFQLEPAEWVGAVCDIGISHARNEDAMACMAEGDRAVLVVCDGVTTSEDSDVASLAAAHIACELLWANNPQGTGTTSSREAALHGALTQAVLAANQAVIDKTNPASTNSAASTIAMTIVEKDAIYCANLGDSRVYWIPDNSQPLLLTKDHSLAQVGIDSGAGRAEAESSVYAHTITKWLGRDAVDLDPYLSTLRVTNPGWVIACTDGLWNYASEPTAIKELVDFLDHSSPLALAGYLVAWANEKGGHDNITVACARIESSAIPSVPLTQVVSEAMDVLDNPTVPVMAPNPTPISLDAPTVALNRSAQGTTQSDTEILATNDDNGRESGPTD